MWCLMKRFTFALLLPLACALATLSAGPANNAYAELDFTWTRELTALFKPYTNHVSVTQDGWVLIGSAKGRADEQESYLIANPESPTEVEQLAFTDPPSPKDTPWPDMLELNDGHLLVELVELPNGRPSLPLVGSLPFKYKTKSFVQNAHLPKDLLVPAPWKTLMGNLINQTMASNASKSAPPQFDPLLIIHPDQKRLMLWNLQDGSPITGLSLSCHPSAAIASTDAKTAWVGCRDSAQLLEVDLNNGQQTVLSLGAPVTAMQLDDNKRFLWVRHSDFFTPATAETPEQPEDTTGGKLFSRHKKEAAEAPEPANLTIFSLDDNTLSPKTTATLPELRSLVMSGYRQQAYGLSKDGDVLYIFWLFNGQSKQAMAMPEGVRMDRLHLHQQKLLWLTSAEQKKMLAFDVRWQEFTPFQQLDRGPVQLSSLGSILVMLDDHGQLSQIDPKKRHLYPLTNGIDLPTQPFKLLPVTATAAGQPALMMVPEQSRKVTEIFLNQQTAQSFVLPSDAWQVEGWMEKPASSQTAKATIRFQDGRLLIQELPSLQLAPSHSDTHDQSKTPDPSEPSDPPSAP